MKKFIYTFILLAGFQFAHAQEVKEIAFQDANGWYIFSENVTFPISTGYNTYRIPIGLSAENTGTADLATGDTLVTMLFLNDSLIDLQAFILTVAWEKDSILNFPLGDVIFPTKHFKSGLNKVCAIISSIRASGTPKLYCANFKVNLTTTGIAEIDNLKDVAIYPNPVSDQLKINNLVEATDINVYSITGQLVKTATAATGTTEIDVTNLSSGIYIVKLQSGKNTRTEKIQVVR